MRSGAFPLPLGWSIHFVVGGPCPRVRWITSLGLWFGVRGRVWVADGCCCFTWALFWVGEPCLDNRGHHSCRGHSHVHLLCWLVPST